MTPPLICVHESKSLKVKTNETPVRFDVDKAKTKTGKILWARNNNSM